MKLGIEIELFVLDNDGRPRVPHWVPFTKEEPEAVAIDGYAFVVHKDGPCIEVACPPVTSPAEYDRVKALGLDAAALVASRGAPFPITLDFRSPAYVFSQAELDLDAYASVMGCDESYSVYPDSHPTPEGYGNRSRFGGMHVSIETDNPTPLLAAKLDRYLGLHSVRYIETGYPDRNAERRQYYGRPGEYRIKDFGIEYRTLPNTFAVVDGDTVFDLVEKALAHDLRTDVFCAETADGFAKRDNRQRLRSAIQYSSYIDWAYAIGDTEFIDEFEQRQEAEIEEEMEEDDEWPEGPAPRPVNDEVFFNLANAARIARVENEVEPFVIDDIHVNAGGAA